MRGQEITIEPVVPIDHRMGGDRTIEQIKAAEMFSTLMWKQEHVDDASEGASAEEIEAMKEARLALPLDFKASTDAWWKQFMDDDELPKVGCKLDRTVKIDAHKLVPVEETREILRGLHIGAHEEGRKAETGPVFEHERFNDNVCGAEVECAGVMPRGAQKKDLVKESVKEVETVTTARMVVAEDWSRFYRNQPGQ